MKHDEFAFFNQQLASMLNSGIPLESALRQLSAEMKHGKLRDELQMLEKDLQAGTPLEKALAQRDLPEFYVRMVLVGAKGNDLPGMLALLADYYKRANSISTRLKGLLVYPMIVLVTSLIVSAFLAAVYGGFISGSDVTELFRDITGAKQTAVISTFQLWLPTVLLALALFFVIWAMTMKKMRHSLRWRLPGFKEANLSGFASSLALMLKKGGSLSDSLAVLRNLEKDSPLAKELTQWEARIAAGQNKFSNIAANSKIIPPLFIWLVTSSGENWAGGFASAADLYYSRAIHRVETVLYAVLPISVLVLGAVIIGQFTPVFRLLITAMDGIANVE